MRLIAIRYCFHSPLFLGLLFSAFSPFLSLWASASQASDSIELDRVEGSTLFFKTPSGASALKPYDSGLFDLKYIGSMKSTEGGVPYFIFSGKGCQNCLEDQALYVIHPHAGKPIAFVYPGKIQDPRTRAVLLQSKAFYGKCLNHKGEELVFFQDEKVDRRKHLQSSVAVAEATKDQLEEALIERHLPKLKTTLQWVKRKSCYPIEGRNRLMLSKPLDLHPHANVDSGEDDDSDQDSEKNQRSLAGSN